MQTQTTPAPNTGALALSARLAAILAVAILVSACSGTDAKVYEGFKCSRVAEMLGQRREAVTAAARVAPLLEGKKGNANKYMMNLAEEFSDDLELHKLSGEKRRLKLQEEFDSDECQRLYL